MILSRGTLHRTIPGVAKTVTNVLPLGWGGGELGGLSVSMLGTTPASGRNAGSFCFGPFMQLKNVSLLTTELRPFLVWRPLVMSLLANPLALIV